MAGYVALVEALRRSLPSSDAAVYHLLAAHPQHSWAVAYTVLAALFAQNYGACVGVWAWQALQFALCT